MATENNIEAIEGLAKLPVKTYITGLDGNMSMSCKVTNMASANPVIYIVHKTDLILRDEALRFPAWINLIQSAVVSTYSPPTVQYNRRKSIVSIRQKEHTNTLPIRTMSNG